MSFLVSPGFSAILDGSTRLSVLSGINGVRPLLAMRPTGIKLGRGPKEQNGTYSEQSTATCPRGRCPARRGSPPGRSSTSRRRRWPVWTTGCLGCRRSARWTAERREVLIWRNRGGRRWSGRAFAVTGDLFATAWRTMSRDITRANRYFPAG